MNVWLLRHGERYDHMFPDKWRQINNGRPYDSPLTDRGYQNSIKTGVHFADKKEKIDIILTSPFLRCLQTTDAFIEGYTSLGFPKPLCIVENGFSEVLLRNSLTYKYPIDENMLVNRKIFQDKHDVTYESHIHPEIEKKNELLIDSYIRFNITFKYAVSYFGDKNMLVCTHADNLKFGIASLIPEIEDSFILRNDKNECSLDNNKLEILDHLLPTNYYNTVTCLQNDNYRINKWYIAEYPNVRHLL